MNWDTSIENFKNYLKLERGLSMNSIESYEFDLIQFKNFIIENSINESPKKCSSSTVKRYLYKNFSNKKSRSQARSISALKSFFNYLLFEGEINSKYSDILFLNRYGRQLTRSMIFKIINDSSKNAKIDKKISPHTLRHSYATHILKNGADLRTIQLILGHESITTTEIYTHLDTFHLEEVLKKYHPREK